MRACEFVQRSHVAVRVELRMNCVKGPFVDSLWRLPITLIKNRVSA